MALHYPPPSVRIPPQKNFKNFTLKAAPPGSQGFSNSSGWMKNDLFLPTVKHFIKWSNLAQKNPSILILDNRESHMTIEAKKLTKENSVHLLTVPLTLQIKFSPSMLVFSHCSKPCTI